MRSPSPPHCPPCRPAAASFGVTYDCDDEDPATLDDACPTAVSDSPLAGFPTSGPTYSILTSGDAALADDPNIPGGDGYGWNVPATAIGPGVYDYQVVRVDLPAASTACLAFDFRFLSDEYPEYVNTNYNDAFIAQLDTWSVAADPATQTVTAPGNFAGGAGDVISVDAGGPSAMVDAAGLGTIYDGATPLLTARAPVAVGSVAHSVPDDLRPGRRDPRQRGVPRQPALRDHRRREVQVAGRRPVREPHRRLADRRQPAEAVEGQVDADVPGELQPASRSGLVQRDRPAGFIPTPGRVATGRDAALAAVTPLASGSATIAPNTTGAIVMGTTNAGVKAIKTAIKKPAKLKAQAKQLLKKAKKLRAEGKIAKAKKLEAKAAKLIKRAKKLARKPLGVIKTTITNPANGASQTFKTVLKRP